MLVTESVDTLVAPASDVQSLLERIHTRVNLQCAIALASRNGRNGRGASHAHVRSRTRGTISDTGIVLKALFLALLPASEPEEEDNGGGSYHGGNNSNNNADDRTRCKPLVLYIDSRGISRGITRCFCWVCRSNENSLDCPVGRDSLNSG
jgi:hypothetical protein